MIQLHRQLALAFALFSAPLVCLAKPEIRAEIGFQGYAVDGGWAPIIATLTLPADSKPWSGKLLVRAPLTARPNAFETPVELAPGTAQRYKLVVPARLAAEQPLILQDDQELIVARLPLNNLAIVDTVKTPLVLDCSPAGDGLNAIRARTMSSTGPQVAHLAPELLPETSWVFDGIGLVALSGLTAEPSAAQILALERYVEAGGILVLAPSAHPIWSSPSLAPLLATGFRAQRLKPDLAACAALGIEGPGELLVRGFEPRVEVDLRPLSSESPLIAIRNRGAGALVTLAFDPQDPVLRRADRLGEALVNILDYGHSGRGLAVPHRVAVASLFQECSERLIREIELLGPKDLLRALFLLILYLAVLSYGVPWIQKRSRIPVLLIVPPLSLLFALGLIALSSVSQSHRRAYVLSYEVVLGPSSRAQRLARRVYDVSLLSNREESFEIHAESELFPQLKRMNGLDALLNPVNSAGYEFQGGRFARLGPIALYASSKASLRMEQATIRELPIRFSQRPCKDQTILEVENLSNDSIGPCAALIRNDKGDRIVWITSLPPQSVTPLESEESIESLLEVLRDAASFWSLPPNLRSRRLGIEALAAVREGRFTELDTRSRKPDEISWLALIEKPQTALTVHSMETGDELVELDSGGHVTLLPAEAQQ